MAYAYTVTDRCGGWGYRKQMDEQKKLFAKIAKDINAKLIFDKNYHFFSGFFVREDRYAYFSANLETDSRDYVLPAKRILIRTAKHEKDFTGGNNWFSAFEYEELRSRVEKLLQEEVMKKIPLERVIEVYKNIDSKKHLKFYKLQLNEYQETGCIIEKLVDRGEANFFLKACADFLEKYGIKVDYFPEDKFYKAYAFEELS
jgi:hypothetical protein